MSVIQVFEKKTDLQEAFLLLPGFVRLWLCMWLCDFSLYRFSCSWNQVCPARCWQAWWMRQHYSGGALRGTGWRWGQWEWSAFGSSLPRTWNEMTLWDPAALRLRGGLVKDCIQCMKQLISLCLNKHRTYNYPRMTLAQRLMSSVCCVQGMVVSLMGHKIRTPNS